MKELKKYKEEELIFYDLESASLVKELKVDTPLYDSWNYKVNKDNSMTEAAVVESYEKESGLYPEFAKIVCISAGVVHNGKFYLKTFNNVDEKVLLTEFNDMVTKKTNESNKFMFCGFANFSFDTPFTHKRMYINGIQPNDLFSSWDRKPWVIDEIDLKTIWKGTSWNSASLTGLATAFGIPSPKDDISGADVGRVYWNEDGGLERISTYCEKDVATVFHIFKKLRFEDMLDVVYTEVEEEDTPVPLLEKLFSGGEYSKQDEALIVNHLKGMTVAERKVAFVTLDAITSTARGKKTQITKADVKALKLSVNGK